MSGRIRTIKPELLEDAATAGLSHEAFRLFVGIILLADDYGRLRGEPRWLAGQVFWCVDPSRDTREILAEVSEARLVVPYHRDGQSYLQIRTWEKHQKVDHRGKERIPGPTAESGSNVPDCETVESPSRDSRETLAPDLRPATSDHGPVPPTPDRPTPDRPSPDPRPVGRGLGFLGQERGWFQNAVRLATRNTGYVAPSARDCGQLLEFIHAGAPGADATQAEAWVMTTVTAFVEATATRRKFYPLDKLSGLARWISQGRPTVAKLDAEDVRPGPRAPEPLRPLREIVRAPRPDDAARSA
jgi:hypothetical protein